MKAAVKAEVEAEADEGNNPQVEAEADEGNNELTREQAMNMTGPEADELWEAFAESNDKQLEAEATAAAAAATARQIDALKNAGISDVRRKKHRKKKHQQQEEAQEEDAGAAAGAGDLAEGAGGPEDAGASAGAGGLAEGDGGPEEAAASAGAGGLAEGAGGHEEAVAALEQASAELMVETYGLMEEAASALLRDYGYEHDEVYGAL
jgi:hypothetical protein